MLHSSTLQRKSPLRRAKPRPAPSPPLAAAKQGPQVYYERYESLRPNEQNEVAPLNRREGVRRPNPDSALPQAQRDFSVSEQLRRLHRQEQTLISFGALGSPNIISVIKGQFDGIEVKSPKGKQSDHQMEFQKNLELTGGKYPLAYSLDDAIEELAT